jgi:hypothetical protein
MEHLFNALTFAALMAAQFFAVVFVAHEHRRARSSDNHRPQLRRRAARDRFPTLQHQAQGGEEPAALVAVLATALCNVGSAATGQRIRFLPLKTRSEERIANINGRNHHPLTYGRFLR